MNACLLLWTHLFVLTRYHIIARTSPYIIASPSLTDKNDVTCLGRYKHNPSAPSPEHIYQHIPVGMHVRTFVQRLRSADRFYKPLDQPTYANAKAAVARTDDVRDTFY